MDPKMDRKLKVLETLVLKGPNFYSHRPCIKMKIDIGEMEERPSNTIPGFNESIQRLLPGLAEHTCSEGVRGGFLTRLRDGTWMGHVVEHASIELQNMVGIDVSYGKARSTETAGTYNVVFQIEEEETGRAAGRLSVDLIEALIAGEPERVLLADEVMRIKLLREANLLGPSTRSIVEEAVARDIPFIRLNSKSYVMLGYGIYAKRIQATITSLTSYLGVEVAGDKALTKKILDEHGIPVPKGYVAEDEEDAVAIARKLGWPVVVKPLDASHGRGILTNIGDEATLRLAYKDSLRHRNQVIVERHVEGYDYRFLIINYKFVAAAQRIPARVIGDGEHSIAELVEIVNRDERRGFGHEKVLTKIELDDMTLQILARHGMTLESKPAAGERVYLKTTANLSTGGISVDVTERVHPHNVHMAERIAGIIGLDICGIDVMAPRVDQPLADAGGAILEVNAAPGFRMHLAPAEGRPRNIARHVVDMLFPAATPARIPIISVTGTNGKTTTARLAAHIARTAGHHVGLTTTEGIYINNDMIVRGDCTGPASCQIVLRDPKVDFAVFETARGGMLRAGLGYDWANVGVVTNIAEDHLGLRDIRDLEDLAKLKRLVVERIMAGGVAVLNAEDPRVAAMRGAFEGRTCYFSLDSSNPVWQEHVERGGMGVTVLDQRFTIFNHELVVPIASVEEVPITFEGRARFNMANTVAAIAATYAAGIEVDDILAGIRTFFPSESQTPGRYNFFEIDDFKVLVDYAHNPHGLLAISELLRALRKNKLWGVISSPGDRRDVDYERVAEIAAGTFDRLIIREDEDLRGRTHGEVSSHLRRGLLAHGISDEHIVFIPNEIEALKYAIERAERDDIVAVFADRIDRVLDFVHGRRHQAARENLTPAI